MTNSLPVNGPTVASEPGTTEAPPKPEQAPPESAPSGTAGPHPLVRLFNVMQGLSNCIEIAASIAHWFDRLSKGGKRMPSKVYLRSAHGRRAEAERLKPISARKDPYRMTADDALRLLHGGMEQAATVLNAMPAAGVLMDAALNPGAMCWSVALYRALVASHRNMREVSFGWHGVGFRFSEYAKRLERQNEVLQRSFGELVAVLELKGIGSVGTPLRIQNAPRIDAPAFRVPTEALTVKALGTIASVSAGTVAAIRRAAKIGPRSHQGQTFTEDEVKAMLRACATGKTSWRKVGQLWTSRLIAIGEAQAPSLGSRPQNRS